GLGVVLYEMIAGRAPFEGKTPSDVIVSILDKEPPELVHYLPEAPRELQQIVTKALRKDVADRFQTSKEMLIDLRILKEALEFEIKLERSVSRDAGGKRAATSPGRTIQGLSQAVSTWNISSQRIPSIENFTSGIKRHRATVSVIIGVLVIAGAAIVYSSLGGGDKAIDSLAVLPFINASSDPDVEYLSDGITESIIFNLSQLPGLKVISPTSVMRYKGKEIDPRTAGRELRVRAVLSGTVVQHGDDLSIRAELVDTQDNRLLWGQQYNRKITDIIAVQEEISREISEKLRLKLTGEEQKRLSKRYTDDAAAYQLYL